MMYSASEVLEFGGWEKRNLPLTIAEKRLFEDRVRSSELFDLFLLYEIFFFF